MPLDTTKPDEFGTVAPAADGEFTRLDIVNDDGQSWLDVDGDYLTVKDMWVEQYVDGDGVTTTLGKESSFARPDWFQYEFTALDDGGAGESRYRLNLGVIDSVLVDAGIHEVCFGHTVSDGQNEVDKAIWVYSSLWEEAVDTGPTKFLFWRSQTGGAKLMGSPFAGDGTAASSEAAVVWADGPYASAEVVTTETSPFGRMCLHDGHVYFGFRPASGTYLIGRIDVTNPTQAELWLDTGLAVSFERAGTHVDIRPDGSEMLLRASTYAYHLDFANKGPLVTIGTQNGDFLDVAFADAGHWFAAQWTYLVRRDYSHSGVSSSTDDCVLVQYDAEEGYVFAIVDNDLVRYASATLGGKITLKAGGPGVAMERYIQLLGDKIYVANGAVISRMNKDGTEEEVVFSLPSSTPNHGVVF